MFKVKSSGTYPYNRAKWDGDKYLLLWKAPWYWPFKKYEEGKGYKLPLSSIIDVERLGISDSWEWWFYFARRAGRNSSGFFSAFIGIFVDAISPVDASIKDRPVSPDDSPHFIFHYLLRLDGSRLYLSEKGFECFREMDWHRKTAAPIVAEATSSHKHLYKDAYTPYSWL